MGCIAGLSSRVRRLFAGAVLLGALAPAAPAAEAAALESYLQQQEELREMLAARDTDPFELDFQPLAVDRILVRHRAEVPNVYHYLTFRLRNRVSDNAEFLRENANAFNEVMLAIEREYQGVSFDPGGSPRLRTDAEAIRDEELATIVARADLEVRTRTVNITAIVTDENGSRFRLFDAVPGDGPQEAFAFEDRGVTRQGAAYRRVREAIEEEHGRRFFSVHEIRGRELLPYNPDIRDSLGDAQGEVYGVLIFDRWPEEGDAFRIRVQGLSNNLRIREPEHAPDEVADYFNTRIYRRTYEIEVERPGDEYYLDQADIRITDHGWVWAPAFQRIAHRASMAYAEYFLDNIAVDRADGRTVTDDAVFDEFWAYYDEVLERVEQRYQGKLDAIAEQRAATRSYYQQMIEDAVVGGEEIARRLQHRIDQLDARAAELEAQLRRLRTQRPDIQGNLEER